MDTTKLKKFAQFARRTLISQVGARLELVLAEGAVARREHPGAMKKLEAAIARDGKDQVIERVAYTWFNRFSALRFMDVNDLNPVRVVSPLSGQFQPEILAEAKAGNIDEGRVPEKVLAQVRRLLDARVSSADPQGGAYRLLLVAICNDWHGTMPFLFERIDDYTELLLPDDLLSTASILAYLREAMTPEVCKDVEVIGWLYQFYISEKKDEVFAGLKKNVKITAENIPAATQLFTPHWIVRYLVENSLGRLWLLNRPQSKLADRMDYYIAPEQPETDFLRMARPEEIRICDPACGSGHMLTYAFDLLHAIYEEEGYEAADIPRLILAHNLYGIEIDDRAGALAAFALAMKAAARLGRRRFLRLQVQPNICVMENVRFEEGELRDYIADVGRNLFTSDLRETLGQFAEAKNFGSLIVPKLKDVSEVASEIASKRFEGSLFLREVHDRVQAVMRMAEFLSAKYHVVVANPPYMGGKGMNGRLGEFSRAKYADTKSDLMTCFMSRCIDLVIVNGFWGMINLPSWMFLSSFEMFRNRFLSTQTFNSLVHLGRGIFGSDFGSVAFSMQAKRPKKSSSAIYRRLFDRHVEVRNPSEIENLFLQENYGIFVFEQMRFSSIPGSPIAYWLPVKAFEIFKKNISIGHFSTTRVGMATGDNDRFVRLWSEVDFSNVGLNLSRSAAQVSGRKWFPYANGGETRKWYGNLYSVVNWENDGHLLQNELHESGRIRAHNFNLDKIFSAGACWSLINSGYFGARKLDFGMIFSSGSPALFVESDRLDAVIGYLNSSVATFFRDAINPTLNNNSGDVDKLPWFLTEPDERIICENVRALIEIQRKSWDSYETSWNFMTFPMLDVDNHSSRFKNSYYMLRKNWRNMFEVMKKLEERNNEIFIEASGITEIINSVVRCQEITLTCNPTYRYGGQKAEAELEEQLRTDTIREFLSYAVGCMFGRYSLDVPGLILADQGDGVAEYLAKVPNPCFLPDEDNVIPMLDGDWFPDDISERFRQFLRVTFGEAHFHENLAFIEEALGKDIRKYFTRDFFNDHVKRYKKRPIYWLFSSPKGTFNALIYMHRYRPDTVSIVLNDYLRELRNKLEAYRRGQEALSISGDASQGQRTKALKEVDAIGKQIAELDAFERDVLFPLASRRIEIDLDDGVKANYPKFGDALKPIKGLSDADDD